MYACEESYSRRERIFLYCSVLSLGGKVNTKGMSQPDIKSIFTKIIYEIFWSKETFSKLSKLMILTSSDTKRTLMHLFLITNSAQRELISIYMYAEYTQLQLTFLALVP